MGAKTNCTVCKKEYEIINNSEICPACEAEFDNISKYLKCTECGTPNLNQGSSTTIECKNCGWKFRCEDATAATESNYFESPDQYKADKNFQKKIDALVVTTAFTVANKEIDSEIGIVTGECVLGMNIFLDVFAEFTDTFGGRSKKTQNRLRELKEKCLEEIKIEAVDMGADAIIGLDLDYSEFSGKGKSMLFLVASGTAVKLKK